MHQRHHTMKASLDRLQQSKNNFQMDWNDLMEGPDYLETRRRFWRRSTRTQECPVCGETFMYPSNPTTGAKTYCSARCMSTAGSRRYNERRRAEGQA